MTLRPTNVYRQLGEEFAYSMHTQLNADALRRALSLTEKAAAHQLSDDRLSQKLWTAAMPLGPEFEPADVSVKLDDTGAFWVSAKASSSWQDGDFARLTRRIQLPTDLVDMATTQCWIEEDLLVLQADRLPAATAAKDGKKEPRQKQSSPTWPKCSLSDGHQRHGCLLKDSKGHRAPSKWTLDLALPEFVQDEVTVSRSAETPGRLVVTARYANAPGDVVDSSVLHEYRREVTPPAGVQLHLLVTRFGADGVLRLEAPAPGLKSRRGVIGIVGGAGGGAGAKIASLTRELRQHATGGFSSASPTAASASAASASAASSSASPAADGEAAAQPKKCAIQ